MNRTLSFEEMDLMAARMEAADECHNLVTQYAFEHSSGADVSRFFDRYWSKREDIVHVMPWGVEVRRDTIEYNRKSLDRVYTPERNDPTLDQGGLFLHTITTRVMEVAEDLQSVRACYLSPGSETCEWPVDMNDLSKGRTYSGEWAWSKYGWDFIKEDGQWKVLNMRVYPIFKAEPLVCWTDLPALPGIRATDLPEGVLPGPYLYEYTTETIVPVDEPEVPLPYKNLESTGKTEIGVGYAAVKPVEVN